MTEDKKTEKTIKELEELTLRLKKAAAEVSAALCGISNEWEGDAGRVFQQKAAGLGEHMTMDADALAEAGSDLLNAVVAAEETENGEEA